MTNHMTPAVVFGVRFKRLPQRQLSDEIQHGGDLIGHHIADAGGEGALRTPLLAAGECAGKAL